VQHQHILYPSQIEGKQNLFSMELVALTFSFAAYAQQKQKQE